MSRLDGLHGAPAASAGTRPHPRLTLLLQVCFLRLHAAMEQYGNQSTYNLETVLKQNINNADFYKNDCLKLKSWSEVIDQIFYQVCVLAQSSDCHTVAATVERMLNILSLLLLLSHIGGLCGALAGRQCARPLHRLLPAVPLV